MHVTQEQVMMRKMVRDFARKEIAPAAEIMEKTDEFPFQLIKKMGEHGLMGIPVPEQYGGAGADVVSYILAIHEISRISAAVGVILSVHTSVGTNPILYFGNEEQKMKYIPKLASGDHLGAFALTEPHSGSDAGSLRTTAIKKNGKYLLNGSKIFITNGGAADIYITFALTAPDQGRHGISAFIVEKNTPGFTIGKKERKLGLYGSNTTELIFDNAEVPQACLMIISVCLSCSLRALIQWIVCVPACRHLLAMIGKLMIGLLPQTKNAPISFLGKCLPSLLPATGSLIKKSRFFRFIPYPTVRIFYT